MYEITSLRLLAFVFVSCAFDQAYAYSYRYGLLVAQSSGRDDEFFCIKYYPDLYNVSADSSEAPKYEFENLENFSEIDTCDADSLNITDLAGKSVLVSSNHGKFNCSIAKRASIIEATKANAVIGDGTILTGFKASQYNLNITVASLKDEAKKKELLHIKRSRPHAKFFIYSPDVTYKFDPCNILMLFMAVFTVAVGSLWSGYTKHALRVRHLEPLHNHHEDSHGDQHHSRDSSQMSSHNQEEISLRVSPLWVLLFVFCLCVMLILLYFFFSVLVYIIVAMFCIASTIATYSCFEPLVMWSYTAFPSCPTFRLPKCNLYCCILNMELRQFLLLLGSISISAVWFTFRNAEWSWILQDILGILFSINMLKVLRLPSFKICVILLSTLFFYDIFFVFITPLLTHGRKSIMVEVVSGAGTKERLPMVLRVPYFNDNPMKACGSGYSMLGFGDILVPGLLISYCHSFDLLKGNRWKNYWVTTNIAYVLGLIATFISFYLMESAQPALLYLVPFIIVPTAILAAVRGDLDEMWKGDFEGDSGSREVIEEEEEN